MSLPVAFCCLLNIFLSKEKRKTKCLLYCSLVKKEFTSKPGYRSVKQKHLTLPVCFCTYYWPLDILWSVHLMKEIMPNIPDICHRHHRRCLWRIFLSCGEISSHDRLSCGEMLHMTDCHVEKALHMRNVKKIYNVEKICVQFMVFLSH